MSPEQSRKLGLYYETFSRDLLRFAHSKVKDWTAAEDLVQRTFVIACAKADILDTTQNPKAWLTETLFREIKNYWRAVETYNSHFEEFGLEKECRSPGEINLLNFLEYIKPAEISENEFQIIKLMAVYGFTCEETAKILGISKTACSKRYQRAKRKMRKYF